MKILNKIISNWFSKKITNTFPNASAVIEETLASVEEIAHDISLSIAIGCQVVSVTNSSITIKTNDEEKTLIIDTRTNLIGFNSTSEIAVGSNIGLRADKDYKWAITIRK